MARCFPLMKCCRFPARRVKGRWNITNVIAVEPIVLSEQPPQGRHAQHVHALASLNALGSSEEARAVGVVEM